MMKNKQPIIRLSGVIAVCLLSITLGFSDTSNDIQAAEEDHSDQSEDKHDEEIVILTRKQIKDFGIEMQPVRSGTLKQSVTIPGEVKLNADTVAHITPLANGIVRQSFVKLGDRVKAGQIIAIIESREVAHIKAVYLSKLEYLSLTQTIFQREETLYRKGKITSEQDYLNAKYALTEASIETRKAENELYALGFKKLDLDKITKESDKSFSMLKIVAPQNGVVIEKHLTLGEMVKDESSILTIADLTTVWVDLQVYPKDLKHAGKGTTLSISADATLLKTTGKISYLSPIIDEHTRTAFARIVLDNKSGQWRPGLFVTGKLVNESVKADILIPTSALQLIEGKPSVFVKDKADKNAVEFKISHLKLGKETSDFVQVLGGLKPYHIIVTKGALILKSEKNSALLEHAGHAH